jgi:hypothetical protein
MSMWWFVGAAQAAGLELTVSPVTSVGGPVDLVVEDCIPGSTVYFVRSTRGPGAGPCPASFGGACIDLVQPKMVGSRPCPAGTAGLSPNFPPMPAGTELSFQAVATNGQVIEKSDVVVRWADQWWHEIAVDGTVANEWIAGDEDFATTSGVGTTWVTWDADRLYVAATHPDVAFGGNQHWLLVYVGDGASGTTTGVQFNTQQPGLPVPFSHVIRWKADDTYNSRMRFDGVGWVSHDYWLGTEGSALSELEVEQTVELAIPWASVGVVDAAVVHVAWLYEGNGFETTYAGVPASAFVDGYDPDVAAVLFADLTDAASPVAQNP